MTEDRSEALTPAGSEGIRADLQIGNLKAEVVMLRRKLEQAEALVETATAWHTMDKLPDIGRKFICLHNDGSGAAMFWRHDEGFIDSDGDEYAELPDSYDLWTELPQGKEFWCEIRSEDPMSLSLPSEER